MPAQGEWTWTDDYYERKSGDNVRVRVEYRGENASIIIGDTPTGMVTMPDYTLDKLCEVWEAMRRVRRKY